MKKIVRTLEINDAYSVLSGAKLQKLEDSDKIRLWKIVRILKPVAKQLKEDQEDASKVMISDYLKENLPKAQEYERLKAEGDESVILPMTEQEYKDCIKELVKAKALVSEALKELLIKEVELEFEPLGEDTLCKLMSANDWTLKQTECLEFLVEQ